MTADGPGLDWAAVDAESDAAAAYLRRVTGFEAIRKYKRETHSLLDPSRGDRFLDVGCGLGHDVAALAEHVGREGDAVGIDRSVALISDARSRVGSTPAARFQVGDALQLPFEDGTFDGCRADRVFQHLSDPEAALAEMCRVTRPGGRITVSDPDWETCVIHAPGLDGTVTRLVADTEWSRSAHPTIGRHLYALVRDVGLTDVTIHPIAVVLTDFATADQVLSIEERLQRLREAEVVSASRVEQWLTDARRADTEETLFCSMMGYTVAGSIPASQA